MREFRLLHDLKYYQLLNRGHSSSCIAGAARGLDSVLFLTSCTHWFDFLSPYQAVQLLCCVSAVEGGWQHQNARIHICTVIHQGFSSGSSEILSGTGLAQFLMSL